MRVAVVHPHDGAAVLWAGCRPVNDVPAVGEGLPRLNVVVLQLEACNVVPGSAWGH